MAELNDPNLTRILVVDDDEIVRTRIKEELQPLGYTVIAVEGAKQALEHLRTERFSVVLSDYEMPEMNGLKFFSEFEDQPEHRDMSRLLFSSGIGMRELTEAIESAHIYRHVSKPWLKEDLLAAVANAVERFRLLKENELLHERNIKLSQKMAAAGVSGDTSEPAAAAPAPTGEGQAAEGEEPAFVSVGLEGEELALEAINKMLGLYHPNLASTARRAVALCQTLSEMLQLEPKQARRLILAAHLHDAGLLNCEVGVVRRWMRDPEKCTEEELAVIETHPVLGEELAQFYGGFADAGKIIRHHHERWDGLGYPDKVKGETIPRLSRYLAPIVWMCNQHTIDDRLWGQIGEMRESAFDPDVVDKMRDAYIRTKMPVGEREMLLLELKADMVLARDIFNTSGLKLLPKGRKLTDGAINKVMSINRLTPIDPYVLVYC